MAHALIIDDNPKNLKVLAQLLSREGVTVTEVSDSRKLQKLIPELASVDVIFLDLEMPGVSGFDARTILREQIQNAPIIAYTVHVSEINQVKKAGFDGFIGKPLDHALFPSQIVRILNGEPVWEIA
jgi:two-component system cell cycle response regulator DivK